MRAQTTALCQVCGAKGAKLSVRTRKLDYTLARLLMCTPCRNAAGYVIPGGHANPRATP